MIPAINKTNSIAPLTQVKLVTPVIAIPDSQNSSIQFEQDQKYQALVEARLFNGKSRVLVADSLLQMYLPEKFQPGTKLELIFISHEPNLKFLIHSETSLETNENHASISTTGRFLNVLLQDALKHSLSGIAQITSTSPILNGVPINSTELPSLLQKAIVQSGLFYESHQAQWINGENTLENLHHEPQSKLMLVTDMSATKSIASAPLGTDMPVNTQSIPLVLQQLTTLETGHLFWRGEIWENQHIEWDIYEESHSSKKNEPTTRWHTQIRLSMPELGDITVKIALDSQNIHIKLNASQLDIASLLKNNQLSLAVDMRSAGLIIQSIEVQHDDGK
ncbi:flagellar hook-length control protein FliK [Nitrosomonas sp. Nm84]|uniref:flagellar hook-length control protein FliK n=1 Tax=Nitrosomonas sp. Nm84 TaxID=200124 RepID=UPI000D75EE61|nr:flagellar hook-length control protein FliK [Nitrosomonas sp. Nm84]PXW87299.1 flagellar hook-length control protein FliK [Nitrosomonas sp. Nm84]